mmetsp:Transcript_7154/g.7321  ORF Transcript_7154/g.7321 Transcript_7154/m.7321 type:complete len:106 (-) Transcript_7154:104-421(-)
MLLPPSGTPRATHPHPPRPGHWRPLLQYGLGDLQFTPAQTFELSRRLSGTVGSNLMVYFHLERDESHTNKGLTASAAAGANRNSAALEDTAGWRALETSLHSLGS